MRAKKPYIPPHDSSLAEVSTRPMRSVPPKPVHVSCPAPIEIFAVRIGRTPDIYISWKGSKFRTDLIHNDFKKFYAQRRRISSTLEVHFLSNRAISCYTCSESWLVRGLTFYHQLAPPDSPLRPGRHGLLVKVGIWCIPRRGGYARWLREEECTRQPLGAQHYSSLLPAGR